ncbi:hypothetical protein HPB48_004959 [Haemaphysalis longicornis]|uniref:Uncharacterized protein n=1 Tax=Haemaphysalis longicornis TaxID=44386 RepID=A0A9J6G481_HAELO|nr:hypothetical protein HPB48_004959 [Haemaphysalis longicornis]
MRIVKAPANSNAADITFTCARRVAMRWRQLRLLLWKSVYLYKLRRNWAITALELLAPLLLTLVQTYLHCNGESFGDIPLPLPPAGTKFAGPDDDSPSVVRTSPLHFPATIGFVPAPGTRMRWAAKGTFGALKSSLRRMCRTATMGFPWAAGFWFVFHELYNGTMGTQKSRVERLEGGHSANSGMFEASERMCRQLV